MTNCVYTNDVSVCGKREQVCQQSKYRRKYGYMAKCTSIEHAKKYQSNLRYKWVSNTQHFTRWFKKMEGYTQNEYRNEIIKQAIN